MGTIRASGDMCSVTMAAPCVIDDACASCKYLRRTGARSLLGSSTIFLAIFHVKRHFGVYSPPLYAAALNIQWNACAGRHCASGSVVGSGCTGFGTAPVGGLLVAIRTVYIIFSSTHPSQNLYFDLISSHRLHVRQRFNAYNHSSRGRYMECLQFYQL